MKPIAIDLFCGCGGMAEGIMKAGFDIVFSNDISEYASLTYKKRHEQLGLIEGKNYIFCQNDIRNINGKFIFDSIRSLPCFYNKDVSIDAVFGGPPCQGFSMAGRRDSNDPRNFLFKEYIRVISEVLPKYVVMENVVGFMSTRLANYVGLDGENYNDGNNLAPQILINEFNKIGYEVIPPQILDASNYGVPQSRRRVIFYAYKRGIKAPEYPVPSFKKISLQEAIGDFYNTNYSSQYITERKNDVLFPKNTEIPCSNKITTERFSLYKEGETTKNVKDRISESGINLKKYKSLINYLSNNLNISGDEVVSLYNKKGLDSGYVDLLLTKKNIRKKLNADQPSLTVVTIPDDYINPFNNNIFSVRELARLQSFDDDFVFYGKRTTGGRLRKKETPQYTQVGNAVPPLLAYNIANSIIDALR